MKAFEKKIEDGQAEAEKLNRRFAAWYYVISDENVAKLRLKRDSIVKDKEKTDDDSTTTPALPVIPGAEKPATEKPATEKPATEKPATEKPATKKPATKKPATKKPAAKKPATKKPAAKKPATKKGG